MQKNVANSLKTIQDTYSSFSAPQKLIAGIGVALLVLGSVFFLRWASTPTMVPLFTKLAGEDAQAITTQLESSGVQYSLGDGGTTVLVPRADVAKSRMDLAAQGLPGSGSKGWSLLDDQKISSTSFQQQVSFQRALQGELNKSIGTISGVRNASVTLALPKDSVFAQEKNKPTASVVVDTVAGKGLSPGQVQAVVHLVSEAVVAMEPENVTVVDADGNLLTSAGGAGGSASQVQAERSGAIRASIQALLDKVVGPGNSIASVQMEMSHGRKTTTEKTYITKDGNKARNSKSRIEKYEGNNIAQSGPMGQVVTGRDNDQVPAVGTAGGQNKMDVTEITENNPVDEKITHINSNGGDIQRLSVSVAVDEKAAAKVNIEDLQKTIAAAALINEERGDVLAVTKMAFDKEAAETQKAALAEADEQAKSAQMMEWIRTGAIALAIIILAIVALVIARRRKDDDFEELAVVPEQVTPAVTTVQEPLAVEQSGMPEVEGPDHAYEAMREDISEMVDNQPDEVAELLRGWLADRRG